MAAEDEWVILGNRRLRAELAGVKVDDSKKTVTLRSGEVWRKLADLRAWKSDRVEWLTGEYTSRAPFEGGAPVFGFDADDFVDSLLAEFGIDESLFD